MPALARQVERAFLLVEGDPHLDRPLYRVRGILDHELDRLAPVESRARDHRILDMIFERVAGIEHRRDPTLRPGGRPAGQLALREDEHAAMVGKRDRGGQPRRAGADDDDVVIAIRQSHSAPSLPFVLSLSKDRLSLALKEGRGFDTLSPNGEKGSHYFARSEAPTS